MPQPRFKSWSPSRLDDYERCPRFAKLKHLDKLCTLCFKGKIMGGFDSPAVCDTCGGTIVKAHALERGTEVGKTLEDFVTGKPKAKLHKEIRHPKVIEIAKALRADKKNVKAEFMLVLDRAWKLVGYKWTPAAWLIVKLDVLRSMGGVARVIDWKTGGLDKKTGEVRAQEKYDDQLALYNTAVLSAMPFDAVTSALVFVDCGPRFNPEVERDGLVRKDLKAAQTRLTKKALPMLSDDVFAPKSSYVCTYCDYGKTKGGPCPY